MGFGKHVHVVTFYTCNCIIRYGMTLYDILYFRLYPLYLHVCVRIVHRVQCDVGDGVGVDVSHCVNQIGFAHVCSQQSRRSHFRIDSGLLRW